MSFLAIHRTARSTLATDKPWLGGDEWSACLSAAELLDRLHELHATQSTRLAEAIADGRLSAAAVARPPSPAVAIIPFPATVVSVPATVSRMRT